MTPTYPETGRTRDGDLPAGYGHIRRDAVVGHGPECFARVREGMRDWRIHKLAGMRVRSGGTPAVGVRFRAGRGLLWVPCEIVWTRDETCAYGYGFGTLPGHPERGEEAFEARLAPDGEVSFSIRAFSRHATWYAKLGAPLANAVQDLVTERYMRSARILAQNH